MLQFVSAQVTTKQTTNKAAEIKATDIEDLFAVTCANPKCGSYITGTKVLEFQGRGSGMHYAIVVHVQLLL